MASGGKEDVGKDGAKLDCEVGAFFLLCLDLVLRCLEGEGEAVLPTSSSLPFLMSFFSSMDPLLGLLLKSRGNPKEEEEEEEETEDMEEMEELEDEVDSGLGCVVALLLFGRAVVEPKEVDVEMGEKAGGGKPRASESVGGGMRRGPDPEPAAIRMAVGPLTRSSAPASGLIRASTCSPSPSLSSSYSSSYSSSTSSSLPASCTSKDDEPIVVVI